MIWFSCLDVLADNDGGLSEGQAGPARQLFRLRRWLFFGRADYLVWVLDESVDEVKFWRLHRFHHHVV